jgi:hypothetical protein
MGCQRLVSKPLTLGRVVSYNLTLESVLNLGEKSVHIESQNIRREVEKIVFRLSQLCSRRILGIIDAPQRRHIGTSPVVPVACRT